MPIGDICALPVSRLAAKDCALFLWAVFPLLPEALLAIDAWGFSYKSAAFVWVKPNPHSPGWAVGTGYWTRANAEVCLLAVKGKPERQAANVRQLIVEPRREHSKKPDGTRERIVQLMGDLPRVELFARQAAPGWDVWGNEITNTAELFGPDWPEAGRVLITRKEENRNPLNPLNNFFGYSNYALCERTQRFKQDQNKAGL